MSTDDQPSTRPLLAWPDVLRPLGLGLGWGGCFGFLTGGFVPLLLSWPDTPLDRLITILLAPLAIVITGWASVPIGAAGGLLVAALVVLLRSDERKGLSWPYYVLHCAIWLVLVGVLTREYIASKFFEDWVRVISPDLAKKRTEDSITSPAQDYGLRCVWGSGTDLFLGGRYGWHRGVSGWKRSQDFRSIGAMWGSSPSDVWGVGGIGQITHFDGRAWTLVPSGVEPNHLNAVWGSGPSDVWAVGQNQTIIHYDGQTWTSSSPNKGTGESLEGIWGSSKSDVWAVGGGGTILHFDGQSWTRLSRENDHESLFAIWGSGPSDIWTGGSGGTVLHYDGTAWKPVTGGPRLILSIWGSGPDDVWFVGERGAIVHNSGRLFMRHPIGKDQDLFSIWGSGPSDVWALGDDGVILHFEGKGWVQDASASR